MPYALCLMPYAHTTLTINIPSNPVCDATKRWRHFALGILSKPEYQKRLEDDPLFSIRRLARIGQSTLRHPPTPL